MDMESDNKKWCFKGNKEFMVASSITVRGVLDMLREKLNPEDSRPLIPLGHGDPSPFSCFRTTPFAEKAVSDALYSGDFNGYSPSVGILPARRAIAKYLSSDLPYKLSPDDVFMTIGCTHAIEILLAVLASPNANILLPRPGFPLYEARAAYSHLEVRHFDLIPEKDWEVNLDSVEALADENTVAMVIINPGNPCGNVFRYQHLQKVAETAKKLGILVISDEVYGHLTFGSNPFVPMGVFGEITPIITIGSISKRWIVPGWRLGWLVTNDPNGILKKHELVDCLKSMMNITTDPVTFIQSHVVDDKKIEVVREYDDLLMTSSQILVDAAVPQIIENTKEDFFSNIVDILREAADICYNRLKDIPCISCPSKPEGSMFVMVKLNLDLLEGIKDDVDFCSKLAEEESVMVLPGSTLGFKHYLRITFAVDTSYLSDGFDRMKAFYQRHAKIQ